MLSWVLIEWLDEYGADQQISTQFNTYGRSDEHHHQKTEWLRFLGNTRVRVGVWVASFHKANDKSLCNQHLSIRAFLFSGNISPQRNSSLLFSGWRHFFCNVF